MYDLDGIFQALAVERRRYVLSCVYTHQTMTLPDVAEYVAEQELDADVTAISDERIRDVYFSLYHSHIPTLEGADLVEYDQAADLVVCADQAVAAIERVQDVVESLSEDA